MNNLAGIVWMYIFNVNFEKNIETEKGPTHFVKPLCYVTS